MNFSPVIRLIVFAISLMLVLDGCTSVSELIGGRYKHDYAQNFERMNKYNFNPVSTELEANADYRFIRDSGAVLAIENAMATKKLMKESYATPDFWLNYYYTGQQTISVEQLNKLFNYNLGLAWDDKYGTGKGHANTSHRFSKNTLIIDLVAIDNQQLIWRGSAPIGISRSDSADEKRNDLKKAVAVIMSPFPPKNKFASLKNAVPD